MSRLLALRLVARCRRADVGNSGDLDEIREALLAEEWARAVELWLLATNESLDVWGSEEILWDDTLDDEQASMEIRLAPIFDDVDSTGG